MATPTDAQIYAASAVKPIDEQFKRTTYQEVVGRVTAVIESANRGARAQAQDDVVRLTNGATMTIHYAPAQKDPPAMRARIEDLLSDMQGEVHMHVDSTSGVSSVVVQINLAAYKSDLERRLAAASGLGRQGRAFAVALAIFLAVLIVLFFYVPFKTKRAWARAITAALRQLMAEFVEYMHKSTGPSERTAP